MSARFYLYTSLLTILAIFAIGVVSVKLFGWSRLETKLISKGTIKSEIYEISAAGWDLRNVSWIDPFGRYCTTIFTNEKGGDIDCDFK